MYLSPFSSVNRKHWCVFAGACLGIDRVIRVLSRWVCGDRAVRNSAHLVKSYGFTPARVCPEIRQKWQLLQMRWGKTNYRATTVPTSILISISINHGLFNKLPIQRLFALFSGSLAKHPDLKSWLRVDHLTGSTSETSWMFYKYKVLFFFTAKLVFPLNTAK